jgi:hypothetical protein
MMQENPYSGILKVIESRAKGQVPITFRLGKVVSVNPLKVTVGGTEQSGTDLLKNATIGTLYSGDTVMLVPFDGDQRFLVLCKVVGV